MDRNSRISGLISTRKFDKNRAAVIAGAYLLIGAVLHSYGFPSWSNFVLMFALSRADVLFDRRMAEVDLVLAAEASIRRGPSAPTGH